MTFVSEQHIERIWPMVVSVPWDGRDTPPPGARKFDALGQRDDAAIASLADAAAFHEEMTPAGVEERSARIADYLRAGLQDLDVPFVTSSNPLWKSSVIILQAAEEIRSSMVEQAFLDSGIITAGVNGFRMSPHVYNTTDHADRIIAAVKKHRGMLG